MSEIPQSTALAEADPGSLSELMSRDPEGFSKQDRARIIHALREDRARREKAEAEAAATGKKRASPAVKPGTIVPPSAGDLGL